MAKDPADPLKVPPDDIELRVKPRPVSRINRKVLMGGTAVVCLFLFCAVLVALDPPDWRGSNKPEELYNTDRKATAEGLSKLPSTYDAIPKLGPPLPGDIGDALQKADTGKGAELPLPDRPYQPDPEADLARADRIRLARLGQQGRESKLFYAVTTTKRTEGEDVKEGAGDSATPQRSPFDILSSAITGATPDGAGEDQQQAAPGYQDRKLAFLNGKPDGSIYNSHGLQKPVSPFTLMAGSIISASLITGLNSDLPGFVIGQVTENVYDTVTGRYLLVPQGTKIVGKYDSVVAYGQKRALIVWQRLIRPDGSSIVIDNLPATDEGGYAGLEDEVDYHTWAILKGIALATLLGVGTEISLGNSESDLIAAIRESAQENTNRAGQNMVERTIDIQPTLIVRPGWPLRIIVHKDLVFR
ncbi:MAG: TrbI/VirB10 family protein [Aestuariivirga sp.]